jgi:hypothetical protein
MRRLAPTLACFVLIAALIAAAPATAAHTQLRLLTPAPDHYIFPGDSVFVNAYVFLPKLVCGKKAKFWIVDGAGKRWNLGRKRPKVKFDPRGQVYKPLKDLSRDAAPGSGKFKSRQKCKRLGQTVKISGTEHLTIVDTSVHPELQNVSAPDGFTGKPFAMKFRLTNLARVEAWIEYELTPGRWEKVDSLTEKAFFKKKGDYTLRWNGKVAGDPVPAGHYRLAIRTRALDLFSDARGPTITDDFFVIQALAEGQFTGPIDAEVTTGDRILVADGDGDRLQVIRFDGSVAQSVGGFGSPQDVAISDAREWFVADYDNHRVVRLNDTGGELGSFGSERFTGDGPQGITFSPQSGGRIYVVDRGSDVEVFTTTGTSLGPFGSGLSSAQSLDIAADGSLWVNESSSGTAHLAAGSGAVLSRTPIDRPVSVSVDPAGRILIGEGGTEGVRVLDASGQPIGLLGPGLVGNLPKGIATAGAAGDFFVVDSVGKRLLRFRLP